MNTISAKAYDKKTKVLYQLYVSQPKLDIITKKYSPVLKQEQRSKSFKIVKVYNKVLVKSINEVKKQLGGDKKAFETLQQRGVSESNLQYTLQRRLDFKLFEQNNKINRIKQESLVKQRQLNLKRKQEERRRRQEQRIRKKEWQLINHERTVSHHLSTSRRKSQSSFIQELHKDSIDMMKCSRVSSSKSEKTLVETSFRQTERNHRFLHLKQSIEKKQQKYQYQFKKAFLLNEKLPKKQPKTFQRRTFQKQEKKMVKNPSFSTQKGSKASIQSKKVHPVNMSQQLIDKKLQKNYKDMYRSKPIAPKNVKQSNAITKSQKSNNPEQHGKENESGKQVVDKRSEQNVKQVSDKRNKVETNNWEAQEENLPDNNAIVQQVHDPSNNN